MEATLFVLTLATALGSALVAGIFFAFSSFIMAALGRIPAPKGISAMQSINVAVLNPVFFAAFFGTGLAALALAIVAILNWSSPGTGYLVGGAVLYIAGCLLVTIVFNVPLNDRLKAVSAESTEGAKVWTEYLSTWTAWNTVRTIACLAASVLFVLALRAS